MRDRLDDMSRPGLTPLDQLARLGDSCNIDRPKDLCQLGSVVCRSDVLFESSRNLLVPHRGGDGDRDRASERADQVENGRGDRHILMRNGTLHSDIRRHHRDGTSETDQRLRADEYRRSGTFRGIVDETHAAVIRAPSVVVSMARDFALLDTHRHRTASADAWMYLYR